MNRRSILKLLPGIPFAGVLLRFARLSPAKENMIQKVIDAAPDRLKNSRMYLSISRASYERHIKDFGEDSFQTFGVHIYYRNEAAMYTPNYLIKVGVLDIDLDYIALAIWYPEINDNSFGLANATIDMSKSLTEII